MSRLLLDPEALDVARRRALEAIKPQSESHPSSSTRARSALAVEILGPWEKGAAYLACMHGHVASARCSPTWLATCFLHPPPKTGHHGGCTPSKSYEPKP